jgi:hypothetical protein
MSEEKDPKEQSTYHRLADVSLRTSATALTILFAYAFAIGKDAQIGFKYYIIGVGVILLFSVFCAVASLFGKKEGEIRYIKWLSIIATILMIIALGFAFLLLVIVLFS